MGDEIIDGADAPIVEGNPVAVGGADEAVAVEGAERPLSGAWDTAMGIIPSVFHPQLTPIFREWDSNFDKKINEVHSQYAPFKDYVENEISPDQINLALQMAQAIQTDPMRMIESITNFAKQAGLYQEATPVGVEQGEQGLGEIPGLEGLENHPRFKEMEAALTNVIQTLVTERQQFESVQQAEAVNTEIAGLKEKFGEFDEEWVLTKAVAAMDAGQKVNGLEPFVQEYKTFEQSIIAKSQRPAPTVLGQGGIAPDNQVNLAKLGDKERRELVTQMLTASAQQAN